nr:uncharacterized protein LOC107281668 isoform X1 [Oryza sativa Japonica Group]
MTTSATTTAAGGGGEVGRGGSGAVASGGGELGCHARQDAGSAAVSALVLSASPATSLPLPLRCSWLASRSRSSARHLGCSSLALQPSLRFQRNAMAFPCRTLVDVFCCDSFVWMVNV